MCAGSHSTVSSTAGRPFFMTIGVANAFARARGKQARDRVRNELRRGVVERGLEHADDPAPGCAGALGLAEQEAQHVRAVLRIAATRPHALREHAKRRRRSHDFTHVVTSAAPVGVARSPMSGVKSTGAPTSRRAVAGAGTGSVPCAVSTTPEPTAIGEAVHGLDAEPLEPQAGACDVDDRVGRADFVEVHLLDRRAVDMRLGLGEPRNTARAFASARSGSAPRARISST
jgi:hypothetical protein